MTRRAATRQPRWYQIAGLVLAGLSSFALAAYWGTGKGADDLVQPVIRSRSSTETASVVPVSVPTSPETLQAAGDNSLQMTARSEHTNGQVAHNPFGQLNLLAGAELAADNNAGSTRRVPTSAKAPKPKVEPPPAIAVVETPPPPPPPPVAPALPFAVVGGISGQQIAGGRPVAFLRQRDEVIVVRSGDEIDKTYRVESITPEKIEFTYLPLQERQTLSIRP